MKKYIFLFYLLLAGSLPSFAQISLSGQLGYAQPLGEAFTYFDRDESFVDFAFAGNINVLYHLPGFQERLAVGLEINGTTILREQAEGYDVGGIYQIGMYGAKVKYRTSYTYVSPYFGLAMGLKTLSTPDVSTPTGVSFDRETTFTLGFRPEVGIDVYDFSFSVGYLAPVKHVKENTYTSVYTAGALQFMVGYHYLFESDKRRRFKRYEK